MDIELLTRFNRKNMQDRQIDTLIGISKGLIADNVINQAEAEFLHGWLIQNRSVSDNPIIINLLDTLTAILEDGVLDEEEARELLGLLRCFAGEPSELGELAKPTSLPIDDPSPRLVFSGKTFLFTGTCAFGSRAQCHQATESLGGLIAKNVTKSLDYLVIGSYVSDSWAHESFGRKIEKAVEYRQQGVPLVIVTEAHWASEGGLKD